MKTVLIILVVGIISMSSAGISSEVERKFDGKAYLGGSSDLFAAFLVAYEEHTKWWKSQGVDLTPRELMTRHYEIRCSKTTSDLVSVSFLPESSNFRGGGITYIVDQKRMKIVEKIFQR